MEGRDEKCQFPGANEFRQTPPQLTPIQADLVALLHEIGAVIEEEHGRWDAGAIEVRLIMQGDGARPVQVAIGPYGDVEWEVIGERQRDSF